MPTDTKHLDVIELRLSTLEKRADEHSDTHKTIKERLDLGAGSFATLTAGVVRVETLAGEIKGDMRWAVKLVLGAVIMAILALVIKSAASQTLPRPMTLPSAPETGSTSSH